MRNPEWITFTGVDDETDIGEMLTLCKQFPIEWGVLFSITRQGVDPRYPSYEKVKELSGSVAKKFGDGLRLSAHLCGQHSRRVMEYAAPNIAADFRAFRRFQINSDAPDVAAIAKFQSSVRQNCIAQSREIEFPESTRIMWLHDASGGRGVTPTEWPKHPGGNRLVGYAGGLGPETVAASLDHIKCDGPYWIDMESNVRTNDVFDLKLCREVCKIVYGAPLQ